MKTYSTGSFTLLLLCLSLFQCTISRRTVVDSSRSSSLAQSIITDSRTFLGSRYKYGGEGGKGFDCSGLVFKVYTKYDFSMYRSSGEQYKQGKSIAINEARPGDLIFFKKNSRIFHVAIISQVSKGSISIIHSTTSKGVIEEDLYSSNYWSKRIAGVKRIIS